MQSKWNDWFLYEMQHWMEIGQNGFEMKRFNSNVLIKIELFNSFVEGVWLLQLLPTNCLSAFDHFVGLAFKLLKN